MKPDRKTGVKPYSPYESSTAIQEGKEMGQAAATLLEMKQPTQQDEDAAIRELLESVDTCPTGGPTGGRKRRGGAGKRGFAEVDAATTEVPPAPAASTLPTTGFFSMGTAPPPTAKKGEPLAKRSRTATASGEFQSKGSEFVDATRGLAGAVVADNLFVVAGAATVSIINPAAASQALAIIKMVSGGVLGCVTPNVVTAALIGAGLWKIVGPYISIGDVASLTGNKLKNLSDSIGNYLKQQETMSKKAQQLKELNSLKSLHRELVKKIEDIKNNKESTQEQEAATLSTLTQEVKAPAPVDTVMNGGRKTKKRGLKKARKTRRGIRPPLFKY
jgi:hypothetical protein